MRIVCTLSVLALALCATVRVEAQTVVPPKSAPPTTVVLPDSTASSATPPTTVQAAIPNDEQHSERMLMRADRRRAKTEEFVARLDSLILSGEYAFWPNSMQEIPDGTEQMIYNQAYYMAVFKNHMEVHLPVIHGHVLQYLSILNFDTFDIANYQVARTQFGWSITFNFTSTQNLTYTANLLVYTLTGETILNLLTTQNTMHYVGAIANIDVP